MSFEFKTCFDGTQPEISEAELQLVASSFATYVDDRLLGNKDNTKTNYEGESRLELTTRELCQEGLPSGPHYYQYAGSGIDVVIKDRPNAPSTRKEVHIQKVEHDGVNSWGGDAISYRLGVDGIVRRADRNKPKSEFKEADTDLEFAVYAFMGRKSVSAAMALAKEFALESVENFQLAAQMGMQNQPIGTAELNAAIALAETAHVKAHC